MAACSLDAYTNPELKEAFSKRLGKPDRPAGFVEPKLSAVRPDSVPVGSPLGVAG